MFISKCCNSQSATNDITNGTMYWLVVYYSLIVVFMMGSHMHTLSELLHVDIISPVECTTAQMSLNGELLIMPQYSC